MTTEPVMIITTRLRTISNASTENEVRTARLALILFGILFLRQIPRWPDHQLLAIVRSFVRSAGAGGELHLADEPPPRLLRRLTVWRAPPPGRRVVTDHDVVRGADVHAKLAEEVRLGGDL